MDKILIGLLGFWGLKELFSSIEEPQSNYDCGIINEKLVAKKLRQLGASKVVISPGSRGPADIEAQFPSGKKWSLQIKSTCRPSNKVKNLTSSEKIRLRKHANRKKSTPIVGKVKNGNIDLSYLNSGRKVN